MINRTERFVTPSGTVLLVEESHALPLVHIGVSLRTGSVHDPRGAEGLFRTTARLLRMGSRGRSAGEVEERIDALGAQLSIGCAPSYIHFGGVVVASNLEPFFALVGQLLTAPALRNQDLARVRRETLAELSSLCDDDRSLAARHFRAFAFGKHPYGRPVMGTTASVSRVTRQAVLSHYEKHFVAGNVVVGMAGAVDSERAQELVAKHLRFAPGQPPAESVAAPRMPKGRRVLIVDKPERTQTQILIGTLGTQVDDPDHTALQVANTIFGGLFTARLTHEVRSKRGLSYGASSSLGHDRVRELWSMWTFPAAKEARACIDLQLGLFDTLVKDGVKPSELRIAKSFLTKSHAFEIDTAAKRLDQAVETEIFELPADYHSGFLARVAAVTRGDANAALKKRLSRRNQTIVVVATAKEVRKQLAAIPKVHEVQVVPFSRV